jgi:hypothetical protein
MNNRLRHLFDDAARYLPISGQIYDTRYAAHVGQPLIESLPGKQLFIPTVSQDPRGDLVRRNIVGNSDAGHIFQLDRMS